LTATLIVYYYIITKIKDEDMLHSCFPERLKSLRQEKNMLQQDLAEHLKVSKSTISGWEVGRNQPSYDTLIELSIFFGVSVDYLIGRRNY